MVYDKRRSSLIPLYEYLAVFNVLNILQPLREPILKFTSIKARAAEQLGTAGVRLDANLTHWCSNKKSLQQYVR